MQSIHGPPIIQRNAACQTTPKCLLEWPPEDILWATLLNVDGLFSDYYFTFSQFSLGIFDGRCAILCSVLFDFLVNKLINVVFFFKIDLKVVQIKIVNQSCVVVFLTNRRNLKFLKLLYYKKLPKTIFFFFCAYLIYLYPHLVCTSKMLKCFWRCVYTYIYLIHVMFIF